MVKTYGLKHFNDRYLLFKRLENKHDYLAKENEPVGVFFAKDYIDFNLSMEEAQGYGRSERQNLTIITPAAFDFSIDDFVLDLKTQTLWRITAQTTKDDNQMKELCLMPRKFTILTLKR